MFQHFEILNFDHEVRTQQVFIMLIIQVAQETHLQTMQAEAEAASINASNRAYCKQYKVCGMCELTGNKEHYEPTMNTISCKLINSWNHIL